MKKLLSVLMAVCLMLSLCGCNFLKDVADMSANGTPKTKTFEFDGLSIELTTDFLQMDFIDEEYDFIVGSEKLTITGIKMLHSDTQFQDFTVSEFADYFRFSMDIENPTELTDLDGIPTMQYTAPSDDGEDQRVAMMYYKADDAFWILCFVTPADKFEGMYDKICKYAKTVKC